MRIALVCLALGFGCVAYGQWTDVRQVGTGGESTVATDDNGNVYMTAQVPAAFYKSTDWGASFTKVKEFTGYPVLGDPFVLASKGSRVNVVISRASDKVGADKKTTFTIDAILSWYSTDSAKTLAKGQELVGDFDREWIVADPNSNRLYMDYADGFIGGPKSKGVFLAISDDDGASFRQTMRIDHEGPGHYALDPMLSQNSDGRLLALWNVSTDYDTVANMSFAYSTDGGQTFGGHKVLASFPKTTDGDNVDTQERWMLGALQGVGKFGVLALFPRWVHVEVDGHKHLASLLYKRISRDGGRTFTPEAPLLSAAENRDAIREFERLKKTSGGYRNYRQTLPWICVDPIGHVHVAFTDNRAGQEALKGGTACKWQTRMVSTPSLDAPFGSSEAVSHTYSSMRPPMDFLSCAADSKYVYVSWTENPGVMEDWPPKTLGNFTGPLFLARKPLALERPQ